MTLEEKKKADEAAKKLATEKKEADALDAAIAKEAQELAEKKKADEVAAKELEEKAVAGDYIMKATHLAWGKDGKNHFYADKKPLINAKVMGKYSDRLKIWIENGHVIKGSYK